MTTDKTIVGDPTPTTITLIRSGILEDVHALDFTEDISEVYSRVEVILTNISILEAGFDLWVQCARGIAFDPPGDTHSSRAQMGGMTTGTYNVYHETAEGAFINLTNGALTTNNKPASSIKIELFPGGDDGFITIMWKGVVTAANGNRHILDGWGSCLTLGANSARFLVTTDGDYHPWSASYTAIGYPRVAQ